MCTINWRRDGRSATRRQTCVPTTRAVVHFCRSRRPGRSGAGTEQAVEETDGQTVLYGGKPILAVFHSSSAGKTAAAGQVWSGDLPYLQSVDSPESEETVPNYYSVVTFTAAEAKEKLLAARPGLKLEGTPEDWLGEVTEDASGRVETAVIGGETWKGTEVRAAFGLRSACFAAATAWA